MFVKFYDRLDLSRAHLDDVLDLWADARRNGRSTIDIRDLDRAVTSEFAPTIRASRTGDAFPRPRLADTAWPEPVSAAR